MNKVLMLLFILFALQGTAQYINHEAPGIGKIKISAGYAHDFPGLDGAGFIAEFAHNFIDGWEGSFGVKHFNITGHPRSAEVEEYTKATTFDLNLFYLPIRTESHIIRLGVGYAFSFFNIRRSYALIESNGAENITHWPVHDQKGKASGISFIGEYEYLVPQTNLSMGLRIAFYQAYDRVTYIGPFAAIAF